MNVETYIANLEQQRNRLDAVITAFRALQPTTTPKATTRMDRHRAWIGLGRLLAEALAEGQRELQAAEDQDAAKAVPLPDPDLQRAILRSLLAAKQARAIAEYDASPKCVSCDRPSHSRLCSYCKEIA